MASAVRRVILNALLTGLLALAGVLVGAYLTHRFNVRREEEHYRREEERREAELKAILRLLDYDRHHIKGQLEQFRDKPTWITDAPSEVLRVAAWEETRVRLAQLLDDDTALADMIKFFGNIQALNRHRKGSADPLEWIQERVAESLDLLLKQQQLVDDHIRNQGIPESWLAGTMNIKERATASGNRAEGDASTLGTP